jgi:hypothetical protein
LQRNDLASTIFGGRELNNMEPMQTMHGTDSTE